MHAHTTPMDKRNEATDARHAATATTEVDVYLRTTGPSPDPGQVTRNNTLKFVLSGISGVSITFTNATPISTRTPTPGIAYSVTGANGDYPYSYSWTNPEPDDVGGVKYGTIRVTG